MIIYGGTIEWIKELSRVLGCHEYYRKIGDRDEKKKTIGY
jgi:hypothetical protein